MKSYQPFALDILSVIHHVPFLDCLFFFESFFVGFPLEASLLLEFPERGFPGFSFFHGLMLVSDRKLRNPGCKGYRFMVRPLALKVVCFVEFLEGGHGEAFPEDVFRKAASPRDSDRLNLGGRNANEIREIKQEVYSQIIRVGVKYLI